MELTRNEVYEMLSIYCSYVDCDDCPIEGSGKCLVDAHNAGDIEIDIVEDGEDD